jgi:DNA-binding response OmpR family regulator
MSVLVGSPALRHHPSGLVARRTLAALKGLTVEENRPRVLALDDNEDTLELIRAALVEKYDILTLANPMDTYELIELFEPDLLILDVMMPKITGFQLVEMLRRSPRTRELPVIILSAKDTARDIKHGYKMGASLYLTKPFDPERLVRNVQTQFEVSPPKGGKKKMNVRQVHMHLQMRASSQGSAARIASTGLSQENIMQQPIKPLPRQGGRRPE